MYYCWLEREWLFRATRASSPSLPSQPGTHGHLKESAVVQGGIDIFWDVVSWVCVSVGFFDALDRFLLFLFPVCHSLNPLRGVFFSIVSFSSFCPCFPFCPPCFSQVVPACSRFTPKRYFGVAHAGVWHGRSNKMFRYEMYFF